MPMTPRDDRMQAICAALLATFLWAGAASAATDASNARCVVYPKGEGQASASGACTYSGRDNFVHIRRADGVEYELRPVGAGPGDYLDQDDQPVYREGGPGDAEVIFRFPAETVHVFRGAQQTTSEIPASPTAPYNADDYDETALLPCSFGNPSLADYCPAGINRHDPGAATILVMKPDGVERTLEFVDDELTSPDGGDLTWERPRGDWNIQVDGYEFYEVPKSLIGGNRTGAL